MSEWVPSSSALAVLSTNYTILNNAKMQDALYDLFSSNSNAALGAISLSASSTYDQVMDQGKQLKTQGEYGLAGAIAGGATAIAGSLGGLYNSYKASKVELGKGKMEIEMKEIKPAPGKKGEIELQNVQNPGQVEVFQNEALVEGSINNREANLRGSIAGKPGKAGGAGAKGKEEENDAQKTEAANMAKQYQEKAQLWLQNGNMFSQLIHSGIQSLGTMVSASYLFDQAAKQSNASLYQGLSQTLNTQSSLYTSALESSSAASRGASQTQQSLSQIAV